jgi:hypothetical protein
MEEINNGIELLEFSDFDVVNTETQEATSGYNHEDVTDVILEILTAEGKIKINSSNFLNFKENTFDSIHKELINMIEETLVSEHEDFEDEDSIFIINIEPCAGTFTINFVVERIKDVTEETYEDAQLSMGDNE